jgi:HAD superfamily hydrolase (TIGR01509 family)
MALRGLLLDFDGTIAETERSGHRLAYNRAFEEFGLDWHWDEALYGDLLGVAGGKERLQFYIERFRPEMRDEGRTEALIAELHRAKIRAFDEIGPTIPLRPGVARLVREARAAGVRVAIATTAAKPGVEAVLRGDPALLAAIDLIAADDVGGAKKPAPDIYLWALAELGLTAGDCVAIEDSNVGLRAALASGLATIVTVSDYTAGQDFSGAAAVVTSLGEPGAAAQSIAGIAPPRGVVDVAFLRAVLEGSTPQA